MVGCTLCPVPRRAGHSRCVSPVSLFPRIWESVLNSLAISVALLFCSLSLKITENILVKMSLIMNSVFAFIFINRLWKTCFLWSTPSVL